VAKSHDRHPAVTGFSLPRLRGRVGEGVVAASLLQCYFSIGAPIRLPHSVQEPS